MAPSTQILLSACVTFGVPLVAAVADLIATRRSSGPDWRPDVREPETPKPISGGSPERRLPQCLLDAAQGRLTRELV